MVNERYEDKYEGQGEGEYQFSDDQANYELEPDTSKEGVPVAANVTEKLGSKLMGSRRMVVGLILFAILLFVVYRMLVPTSAPPATDFSASAPEAATPATLPPAKLAEKPPIQAASQPPPLQPQSAQPANVPQSVASAPVVQAPPSPPVSMPQQPNAPLPSAQTQPQPLPSPPQTGAQPDPRSLNPMDRLASLEQQNSAILNLLQTQYTQKMSDYETQNGQLRNQVQELNTRLSSMEVAFRQLTKMLRGGNRQPYAPTAAAPPARSVQPRVSYTVQAIIPGRAWLKSDAGDTVTVAEGDMLKDYGRITKIDPYDGIVDIDTGNKVISLSYGVSGN